MNDELGYSFARPWAYVLDGHTAVPEYDLRKWATWFEAADRRVAWTEITPGIVVSTVFLGLDHECGEDEPVLFETIIFVGLDKDRRGGRMWRYHTWEEAEAGHAAVVADELAGRPIAPAATKSRRARNRDV